MAFASNLLANSRIPCGMQLILGAGRPSRSLACYSRLGALRLLLAPKPICLCETSLLPHPRRLFFACYQAALGPSLLVLRLLPIRLPALPLCRFIKLAQNERDSGVLGARKIRHIAQFAAEPNPPHASPVLILLYRRHDWSTDRAEPEPVTIPDEFIPPEAMPGFKRTKKRA